MRYFDGEIIESGGKFSHPASIIVSGSSGYVKIFKPIFFLDQSDDLTLKIIFRVGKTKFCYNLVKNQHFSRKIRHLHYFGTGTKYSGEKLDWHKTLKDVAVHYHGIFI